MAAKKRGIGPTIKLKIIKRIGFSILGIIVFVALIYLALILFPDLK